MDTGDSFVVSGTQESLPLYLHRPHKPSSRGVYQTLVFVLRREMIVWFVCYCTSTGIRCAQHDLGIVAIYTGR